MRLRGGQTLFAAGKDDDLATSTVHEVHINWVHPSTNCPSEIYCPTPTKRVQLIKMRKQEVSLLTCATSTDDACGRYWKRKANRGGRGCVPKFYDRMNVHRNRFLVNKANRCIDFQFYWNAVPSYSW
jgi:hypothetical protein